jgi:hypothetical protein
VVAAAATAKAETVRVLRYYREDVMGPYANDGPARRPVDHGWVVTAWVLPLAVAIGFSIATAGFGAITIPFAIMIGLISTVLRFSGRNK